MAKKTKKSAVADVPEVVAKDELLYVHEGTNYYALEDLVRELDMDEDDVEIKIYRLEAVKRLKRKFVLE